MLYLFSFLVSGSVHIWHCGGPRKILTGWVWALLSQDWCLWCTGSGYMVQNWQWELYGEYQGCYTDITKWLAYVRMCKENRSWYFNKGAVLYCSFVYYFGRISSSKTGCVEGSTTYRECSTWRDKRERYYRKWRNGEKNVEHIRGKTGW